MQALQAHHEVVTILSGVAGTGETDAFLLALGNTHESKAIVRQAEVAYNDHIREHKMRRIQRSRGQKIRMSGWSRFRGVPICVKR